VTGKTVGRQEEKARKAKVEQRTKERKLVKTYINKLAKNIGREIPDSVRYQEAQQIQSIQDTLDVQGGMLKKRTKATIEMRQRLKEAIDRNANVKAQIPERIYNALSKKTIDDFTIKDMEDLSDHIKHLARQGKIEKQLEDNERDYKWVLKRDVMINDINGGKETIKLTAEQIAKKPKQLKKFRLATLLPQNILDKVGGGGATYENAVYQNYYRDVNTSENSKTQNKKRRVDTFRENLSKKNIKEGELLRQHEKIDGVPCTVADMLFIYNGMKNRETRLALEYGNRIKPETMEKIKGLVEDKYKQYLPALDAALNNFQDKDYWRVHDTHVELTNQGMGYIENYLPIYRREIDKQNLDKAMSEDLLNMYNLRRAYPGHGFAEERIENIPPEFQKPIKTNLLEILYDAIERQEHYIAYGRKIRDLQEFNKDTRFREAILSKHDKETMLWIEDYTNILANPNYYKLHSDMSQFWTKARENASIAYLVGNLITIGKQVPSIFYYMQEARAYWIPGIIWTALHPKQALDFVNEDPQMQKRGLMREQIEAELFSKNVLERIRKKITKAGFVGIMALDKAVVTGGYIGVYNRYLDKTGNAQYARQKALETTLRTQPAAHVKDIAAIYRSNEFLNMFLQFSNQLNKIYNIATYNLPQHVLNGKVTDAVLESTGLAIGAISIWAISHRKLPKDKEDLLDAFTELFLNMIPVFGKSMAAAKAGWQASTPPIIKAFGNLGLLLSNKASDKQKLNRLLESLSLFFGLPYIGSKRLYKTISEKDLLELIGGKPL